MAAAIKAGDAYLLDINACTVPSSQVDPGKGGQGTGMSASELQDPCPAALTEQTGCMAAGGAAEIVMI